MKEVEPQNGVSGRREDWSVQGWPSDWLERFSYWCGSNGTDRCKRSQSRALRDSHTLFQQALLFQTADFLSPSVSQDVVEPSTRLQWTQKVGGNEAYFKPPKGFPHTSVSKEPVCNVGDLGLIPGSGRSSGEGNGNPLQYSCLENPMDRGAWQVTVHGAARVRHNLATQPPPSPWVWGSLVTVTKSHISYCTACLVLLSDKTVLF